MLVGCAIGSAEAQNSMEPMVTASWHQSAPFNNECPNGSAAGCGAIAVAQILNCYKMPAHGYGRATYKNVDVDFDSRSIDWANVRDSYPYGMYSATEGTAVAGLVFQVGAAMKMKYGSSSSPHNYPSMMWGLQHYLHFSPQSRYRHRHYYSTAEWIEMLDRQLQSGHPVLYRGDHTRPDMSMVGHIYVIDGIDGNGLYHFNFGHASSEQDKYTDLNIVNQGDGVWPGIFSVSYHHSQAMVTDCYPVGGLSDSDYDHTALVLNSPMVLGSQPAARTVEAKGSVQATFQFRYVSFGGGSCQYSLGFYRQGELKAVSNTVRTATLSDGGYGLSVDRSFTLPDGLSDGSYEMSIVSRDDEGSPWIRGWDNAPNTIPVRVKDGLYTFSMPDYHNLDTYLYIPGGTISEVDTYKKDGKTLELTVCNPSTNNFEDSLRLVVNASGKTQQYHLVTSIYEGQSITYRFFVADSEIDTSGGYSAAVYYKDTNSGDWLLMPDTDTGIPSPAVRLFDGVEVYTLGGMLLSRIARSDLENIYPQLLSTLPRGIYFVRDNNGTRKIAIQR